MSPVQVCSGLHRESVHFFDIAPCLEKLLFPPFWAVYFLLAVVCFKNKVISAKMSLITSHRMKLRLMSSGHTLLPFLYFLEWNHPCTALSCSAVYGAYIVVAVVFLPFQHLTFSYQDSKGMLSHRERF